MNDAKTKIRQVLKNFGRNRRCYKHLAKMLLAGEISNADLSEVGKPTLMHFVWREQSQIEQKIMRDQWKRYGRLL